jgi:hypothetical protein
MVATASLLVMIGAGLGESAIRGGATVMDHVFRAKT